MIRLPDQYQKINTMRIDAVCTLFSEILTIDWFMGYFELC